MEALVLAAGLGTRLRPLTDHRPKALVEVEGRTLLEICIARLAQAGVQHCVVNIHHFGDMMLEYIAAHSWPCRVSVSDERQMLLDTGGALRHAAPLFTGHEPVLVHNVDVLSTIDLHTLEAFHCDSRNLVTLCASMRTTKRPLAFNADGLLAGRYTEPPCQASARPLAFSGISMVDPALFALLPPADHPYPVIDEYIRLATTYRIGSYLHDANEWLDVGRPETLAQAPQILAKSL